MANQRAEQQLDALLRKFGKLPFFCVNDTCDEAADDDLRLLRIAHTPEKLLPEPSSFERLRHEFETTAHPMAGKTLAASMSAGRLRRAA